MVTELPAVKLDLSAESSVSLRGWNGRRISVCGLTQGTDGSFYGTACAGETPASDHSGGACSKSLLPAHSQRFAIFAQMTSLVATAGAAFRSGASHRRQLLWNDIRRNSRQLAWARGMRNGL
jgi:hypothetical protein